MESRVVLGAGSWGLGSVGAVKLETTLVGGEETSTVGRRLVGEGEYKVPDRVHGGRETSGETRGVGTSLGRGEVSSRKVGDLTFTRVRTTL